MKKEYKIIRQEDDATYQRLNKQELESRLNELAEDDWHLHTVTCAQVPGGARNNEFILFLERDCE